MTHASTCSLDTSANGTCRHSPSQADVKTYQATQKPPNVGKFPYAYRWYKHIASFESEFSSLPGDPSKEYTAYGPEASTVTVQDKPNAEEDDDDVDLFGSDDEEEDAEAARVREERLAEYKKKKEGKTKPAAKSIVTLDVKPWDDETDMEQLQKNVLAIEMDGLVWAKGQFVAVGFGIKKLQINLVVEDDKVSLDDLQAKIEEDEDHVQSTDIVSLLDDHNPVDILANMFHTGCHAEVVSYSWSSKSTTAQLGQQTWTSLRRRACTA